MRAVLGIAIALGGVALLGYVVYGVSLSLNTVPQGGQAAAAGGGGIRSNYGPVPSSTGGSQ